MTEQGFFFNNFQRKNAWYGIILMVIVLILLYFLVKSIFTILYWLSPLLIILTIIFDYKVIIQFAKWVWKLLKSNLLYGILVIALSALAFPVLAGGLFINAFMNWRMRRLKKKYGENMNESAGKFSDFELLEEGNVLDLEELEREDAERKKGS